MSKFFQKITNFFSHQKILPIAFQIAFFSLQNLLKFPLIFPKSLQFFKKLVKFSPFLPIFLFSPEHILLRAKKAHAEQRKPMHFDVMRRNITHFYEFLRISFRVSEQLSTLQSIFLFQSNRHFPRIRVRMYECVLRMRFTNAFYECISSP